MPDFDEDEGVNFNDEARYDFFTEVLHCFEVDFYWWTASQVVGRALDIARFENTQFSDNYVLQPRITIEC